MSRRSIVILAVLGLLGAWGLRHAFEREPAAASGIRLPSTAICSRNGVNPPQRLPLLHDAVSISFTRSQLVAVDRQGNVWTYFRGESKCDDPAPFKVLAGGTAEKPYPTAGLPREVQRNAVLMDGQVLPAVGLEFPDRCGIPGMKCTPSHTAGIDGIVALADGDRHTLLVRRDGSVWSSGMNDCGQLGREQKFSYPETEYFNYPEPGYFKQVPGMRNIVAVAAGMRNSMALDAKGVVWVWGSLSNPMLDAIPPPVPGYRYCTGYITEWAAAHHLSGYGDDGPEPVNDLPRIRQISTYQATDLALDTEGHVWGWGSNSCGQVGLNPGKGSDSGLADVYVVHPRRVEGLPPIRAVAAGKRHALALDTEGRIWAWGENDDMELGQRYDLRKEGSFACGNEHGDQGTRLGGFTTIPRQVPGIGKAVAVAAGFNSSAAIDEHGDVWVWGRH